MGAANEILARSLLAQSQATPRPLLGSVKTVDKAREVAEDFESFFISQMVGYMFSGIKTDGPLGGGQAETIYRSLLSDEYGKLIGRSGGIGIADAVQREIIKLQEINS